MLEASSSHIASNVISLTFRKHQSCIYHQARSTLLQASSRAFTTSHTRLEHAELSHAPRWRETPRAMKAPFRTRLKPVDNDYLVNEDPELLDQAYRRMLGSRGDKMLSEEVKWLAVTHKSFDQGRRGFNDRLAYFGRRILELQTSLALLNMPRPAPPAQPESSSGLIDDLFKQSVYDGLENVSDSAKAKILNRQRLFSLACDYKLREVTRWKPKKANDLMGSGIQSVVVQSLYAIIGTLALKRGSPVADETARERILRPLGVFHMPNEFIS